MEGVRNPEEKKRHLLSFPLGLVFGWGVPYSIFFSFPNEVFIVFLKNSL